jgi:hypothetical protein
VSYPDDGQPGNYCNGPCLWDRYLVIGAEKHDAGSAYPSYNGHVDELRLSTVLRYAASFTPPSLPFSADSDTVGLFSFDQHFQGAAYNLAAIAPVVPYTFNGSIWYGGSPAGPVPALDQPFGATPFVVHYGHGSTTSIGSVPTLAASGAPLYSTQDLVLHLSNGVPNKPSVFLYGPKASNATFGPGRLYVGPPFMRLPASTTDASGSLSQAFPIDFAMVGTLQCIQGWTRDPALAGASKFALTDALAVQIGP